jgi:hypothetical protein
LPEDFCVAENLVKISSVIKEIDEQHQELNLILDISQLNATFPLTDIKVVILKNYNWNDTININSAPLLRDQRLYLDMPYQIVAEGEMNIVFSIQKIPVLSRNVLLK